MASMKRNRSSLRNRRRQDYVIIPNGFEPRDAEVGEPVKIGLQRRDGHDYGTEWMWVHVRSRKGRLYSGVMANTGYANNARRGDRVWFTSENILTTWDNCPLRAMQDLQPLSSDGIDVLDLLRQHEAETGLGRRAAVADLLERAGQPGPA